MAAGAIVRWSVQRSGSPWISTAPGSATATWGWSPKLKGIAASPGSPPWWMRAVIARAADSSRSSRRRQKQHRHAAPHRKGGIGEAIGIEIEDLPAAAAPPRQQAAPFGHEPELITAGGILEDPVGPGVFDRPQGLGGQAEALDRPYPHRISVSGSPGAGLCSTLPRSAHRHGLMPEAMATA